MKNQGIRVLIIIGITILLIIVSLISQRRLLTSLTGTPTPSPLSNILKRIDNLEVMIKPISSDYSQSGKAVLTALPGGKTKISITTTNNATTSAQPTHIHNGNCSNPEESIALLVNLKNGASESIIDRPISELVESQTSLIIRKSANQVFTYVACADIKLSSN